MSEAYLGSAPAQVERFVQKIATRLDRKDGTSGVKIARGSLTKASLGMESEEDDYTICHLKIGEGVTSLSDGASQLHALSSVEIPESVTGYDRPGAFYDDDSLVSCALPRSLSSVGGAMFMYCWNLRSVTLPNTITSIGEYAFYAAPLTGLYLPSSVVELGENAFGQNTEAYALRCTITAETEEVKKLVEDSGFKGDVVVG